MMNEPNQDINHSENDSPTKKSPPLLPIFVTAIIIVVIALSTFLFLLKGNQDGADGADQPQPGMEESQMEPDSSPANDTDQ